MGFPSRLLNDGEYVVVTSRSHGKTLTGPVLVLLVTVFAATFAAVRAARELTGPARTLVLGVVLVVAAALLLSRVLVPFLRWHTTTYTFTDRRFVVRSGVLAREARTVPLDRIAGIDVEMGVLDRVLRCGTLVVSDAGEDGRFELHDVPRVEEVQTRVADQVHRLRHVGRRQHPLPAHAGSYVGEDSVGGYRLDHSS